MFSPLAPKTILIYGHFDVQPPEPLDEWESPPFEPAIRDGRIFGRGSADNKGQLFAHIKALEAILNSDEQLPVNIKFLFDPEEEIGSPSLENFCMENADRFKADLAYISDAGQDPTGLPIVFFGVRGSAQVEINYQEANHDLHSGNFGGPVPNPNWRIIDFLSTLRDPDNRVAIEGFYDDVIPPTTVEREAMAKIPFDQKQMLKQLGLKSFAGPKDMGYWEKIMFQPTLDVCGYNSGYAGEGIKTVLPCKSNVKLSMRLVKNQTSRDILVKFRQHVEKHGFTDLDVSYIEGYNPCKTPIDHPMSNAICSSVKRAFEKTPIIYPLIGGSLPSSYLADALGVPVITVPYGNHDECNHAPNENLVIDLFIRGIKCSATVFYELSNVQI
jgi:acetylornithine deacetylase/succinyl-diaminopimelate desuccinylase-like protein